MPNEFLSEKERHNYFLQEGMDIAIENLLHIVRHKADFIGFSIGGTLIWKAALSGLPAQKIMLLSSTRIRFEEVKPLAPIKLIYGANDPNIPDLNWSENMNLEMSLIAEKTHSFYQDFSLIEQQLRKFLA